MKKFYWRLLTLLIVAVLSVGFVSCGSDDDDKNSTEEKTDKTTSNALVGSWYAEDIDDYGVWKSLIVFKSDGTFQTQVYEKSSSSSYTWNYWAKGTYTYDASTKELVCVSTQSSDDEVGIPYTISVVSVSSSKLVILNEDGDPQEYTKSSKTSL